VFAADRGAIELDDPTALQDAVDDGVAEVIVVQHATPLIHRLVRREEHRPPLQVPLVDHVEEHVRGVVAVGEVAHLVDDEDVRVHVAREDFAQATIVARTRQVVDELCCRDEASLEAQLDGTVRDGDGEVRLPAARFAMQHEVVTLGDEVGRQHRAEHREPQRGLQREVVVVHRLQEGEAGIACLASQPRLLSVRDFFAEEDLEELLVGPVLLLGAGAHFLPCAASVREMQPLEDGVEIDGGLHWATSSASKFIAAARASRSWRATYS
jgi:hypothetical protein